MPGTSAGRVCIVTGEIAGPDYNGGIGTSNRGLALALKAAGFTVDVLYTRVESGQPFCFRGSFEEQVAAFRSLGIGLMCIDHKGNWNDWLAKSLRVMETLQSRPYDIAFFDDTHGTAYYTALAKHTGSPALAHTKIVVVTHSATQWICELNQTPVTTLADIRLLEMERRSIELADYVVSPSAYILRKYQSYGWKLPAQTLVRPNILPFSSERPVPPSKLATIDEIVFFGRLERRKGLWLFCAALDRLKYDIGDTKVTFLGKFTMEDGESTGFGLMRRSAAWPFSPTLLYNYDRDQALAYLKGGNRLAVMPSREDNSPSVILECLVEGIPFLASAGGGGQELISAADHQHCIFEPTVDGLTAKLRNALSKGVMTGQPSFKPRDNAQQTIEWVSALVSEARSRATRQPGNHASPAPARRSLVLIPPQSLSSDLVIDGAAQVALRHRDCAVLVFAEDVSALRETARKQGMALPDNLLLRTFDTFADEMIGLQQQKGLVVLARLDQPVPDSVIERAEIALHATAIDALTVMRGHAVENTTPERPFICADDFHWEPESFKTGNALAVMSLAVDSNAGLVILRSADAGVLSRVSMMDPQLCRPKDVQLFIHEVLLELMAEGRSFELMPDCFVPAAATTATCETFALPGVAMRHLQRTKDMPSGTEAALLSRLAIEVFAGEAGKENAEELLSDVSSRLGDSILRPNSFWPASRAFATYAKIASVAGRPDLSLSLMGHSLLAEKPMLRGGPSTPAALAMSQAHSIDLAVLVAEGRHSGLNLDRPWNLKVDRHNQEIEVHPNGAHEGVATLIVNGVSIPPGAMFAAELELRALARGPVRFEIEIQSPSAEPDYHAWVLSPGERKLVEFKLPDDVQGTCDVLLMTRMAKRHDSTEGAHAKWHGPAFKPL